MKTQLSKSFFVFLLAFIACNGRQSENSQTNSGPVEKPDAEDSIKVSSPVRPVLGIDVSHFQGKIDWKEVKDAGIHFVFDKATQGVNFLDPKYQDNILGAREAKLLHGSYHFYITKDDPKEQANFFLSKINHDPGDLPPVLDIEQGSLSENTSKEKLQTDLLVFLETIEKAIQVKPIIYTNHPFGDTYLTDPKFGNYDLWIAEYGVSKPKIPKVWQERGWLIWQRTDRGTVEGLIGNVDHDILHESKELPVLRKP
jgi:lysozyme